MPVSRVPYSSSSPIKATASSSSTTTTSLLDCQFSRNGVAAQAGQQFISQEARKCIEENLDIQKSVLSCIRKREALLERMQRFKEEIITDVEGHTSSANKKTHIFRLLQGLRNSSLDVVEAIEKWSKAVNGNYNSLAIRRILTCLATASTATATAIAPMTSSTINTTASDSDSTAVLFREIGGGDDVKQTRVGFRWNGEYYILKMLHDLKFLQNVIPDAIFSFIGNNCNLQRNPFLLPFTVADLLREGPMGGNDGSCSFQKARIICSDISGISIKRLMSAVAAFSLEEYYSFMNNQLRMMPNTMDANIKTTADATIQIDGNKEDSSPLRKKKKSSKQSPAASRNKTFGKSPANAAAGGATTNISNRKVQFMLPTEGKETHNALAQRKDIQQPQWAEDFVAKDEDAMERRSISTDSFSSESTAVDKTSQNTVQVLLENTLANIVDDGYSDIKEPSRNDAFVFITTESSNVFVPFDTSIFEKFDATNESVKASSSTKMAANDASLPAGISNLLLCDDSPLEARGKDPLKAITKDEMQPIVEASSSNSCVEVVTTSTLIDLQTHEEVAVLSSSHIERVPYPLPFLVEIAVGSRAMCFVSEANSSSNLLLQTGDIIKIGSIHNSIDWIVSSDLPPTNGTLNILMLTEEYKDFSLDTTFEDHNSIQLALSEPNISRLRAWKLIPKSKDLREPWRIQYDNGDIPWSKDFESTSKYAKHFHARIPWISVEDKCRDHPFDPNLSLHQQRVEYFGKVPISFVIDKTFQEICSWHPVSSNVENFKWSIFARKMMFLATVKNPMHEVDMAFFRQTARRHTRKLDLPAFKAILADLASIQFPLLLNSPEQAIAKLLLSTVVMLPFVNKMVWKEAKTMAVLTEARRTCAQMRLASLYRSRSTLSAYRLLRGAEIRVAAMIRKRSAQLQKSCTIAQVVGDLNFRCQYMCSLKCQTAWRRYHSVHKYWLKKILVIEIELEFERTLRKEMKSCNNRIAQSILFQQVQRVRRTVVVATVRFTESPTASKEEQSLEIQIYIPSTRRTCTYALGDQTLCNCFWPTTANYLNSVVGGRRQWLLSQDWTRVCDKLTTTQCDVDESITVVFKRQDINERGVLIARHCLNLGGTSYLLSIIVSSLDFIFIAYDPLSCTQIRKEVSAELIVSWYRKECGLNIIDDYGVLVNLQPPTSLYGHTHSSISDQSVRLDFVTRLIAEVILVDADDADNNNDGSSSSLLTLRFFNNTKKKLWAAPKIQGLSRMWFSRVRARAALKEQYEKVYDREQSCIYYLNCKTDERSWTKPTMLGPTEDLQEPKHEWRKVVPQVEEEGQEQPCCYYFNPASGQTSRLSEEDAAVLVQKRFRKLYTLELLGSFSFEQVVGAVNMVHDAKHLFELEPGRLPRLVNYALSCHCLTFDFKMANELYTKAIELSPMHPIIARSYGLFILATSSESRREEKFSKALQLFRDANVGDPDLKMFSKTSEYFFHWAVTIQPMNPMALLNYALLQQCVERNYNLAEKLYIRAISIDPWNTQCIENFEVFERQRYPGGAFESRGPSFSIVRRSRVFEEKTDEWGEWQKLHDPFGPFEEFKLFWYNKLTKVSQFSEPDWDAVWRERIERSSLIIESSCGNSTSQSGWTSYWDDRLKQKYLHNKFTSTFTICTNNDTGSSTYIVGADRRRAML